MHRQSNVTGGAAITQPALLLCGVGVLGFSFTLPATRLAGAELHPMLLGPGRGAPAALVAIALLIARREALPTRAELPSLLLVALGVIIGFPLCTAYALQSVPAQHAVVIVGLSPLATSLVAVLRNGERPSRAFWLWAFAGAASVLAFAGAGSLTLEAADGLLLLAVAVVAVGYAEGGRLSRTRDGLWVVCWGLVLALPFTGFAALRHVPATISMVALSCFAWLSMISALIAFAAWYRGLAMGVARGSQVQLLQPVLSLAWCALLLGEPITPASVIGGTAVLISAVGSRLARA